jgi:Fic family protein
MLVRARYEAALQAMARLETLEAELGDPWLVSRVLARQEALSSSAIEGTQSTLDELLAVEETGDEAALERDQQTARQVRDYALALDGLLPEAKRLGPAIFTQQLICQLHATVMRQEDGFAGVPGQLRDRVVWIGGHGSGIAYSTYNPTPPAEVAACLDDTLAYMRGETSDYPPGIITYLALSHAHFEAVHPFTDGNGRVGRLLLPLAMAAAGHVPLYLSPYVEAHKAAYYAALKAAQQRLEWHEMIGFVADAITGTVAGVIQTRDALRELSQLWRVRRRFRAGSASLRALDLLPHYPILTIGRLATLLGVSWPQAAQAVAQLVEVDILRERTGYRRNRLFSAHEVLTVLNRPFGEEPMLPGMKDDRM